MDNLVIIGIAISEYEHLAIPTQIDTEHHCNDDKEFVREHERSTEVDLDKFKEVWDVGQDNSDEIAKGFSPGSR